MKYEDGPDEEDFDAERGLWHGWRVSFETGVVSAVSVGISKRVMKWKGVMKV